MGVDWIAVSACSGAVVAAGTISVFVFRHVHPKVVAVRQFWAALVGVEENVVTGQRRAPGLFERLDYLEQRIEERLDQQDATLAAQDHTLGVIRHEVEFNTGSSIKDAVKRIENRLDEHLKKEPDQ